MIFLLSLVAIILSILAIFAYQWVTFVPRLGIATLYYLRRVQFAVAAVALGSAAAAYSLNASSGQLAVLLVTVLLTPLSGFLQARRVIRPLTAPKHLSPDESDTGDQAPILGIEIDGTACAWPLELLVPHHIVNDRIGDVPVLAAWCHACRSGIVYAAAVDGRTLTFDVEAVWRRNMIMRDHQTGTLWQHATGEALIGPLKGSQLSVLGGERTTWGDWRHEHPDGVIVAGPARWRGLLPLWITNRMLDAGTRSGKAPGLIGLDDRLPPNEEVAGISIGGEARAYPIAVLRERRIIEDEVGGVPIVLVCHPGTERVRAFRRLSDGESLQVDGEVLASGDGSLRWDRRGKPIGDAAPELESIHIDREWWGGWIEFHPGTTVYSPSAS